MAFLSCHVSINLPPPKISADQDFFIARASTALTGTSLPCSGPSAAIDSSFSDKSLTVLPRYLQFVVNRQHPSSKRFTHLHCRWRLIEELAFTPVQKCRRDSPVCISSRWINSVRFFASAKGRGPFDLRPGDLLANKGISLSDRPALVRRS